LHRDDRHDLVRGRVDDERLAADQDHSIAAPSRIDLHDLNRDRVEPNCPRNRDADRHHVEVPLLTFGMFLLTTTWRILLAGRSSVSSSCAMSSLRVSPLLLG
jgi:hypothetical protein